MDPTPTPVEIAGTADEETKTIYHHGRSWTGHRIEDDKSVCPCPQAPCGLIADDKIDPACTEHTRKTTRQRHSADDCPAH